MIFARWYLQMPYQGVERHCASSVYNKNGFSHEVQRSCERTNIFPVAQDEQKLYHGDTCTWTGK
jgi:hypothetical protein